MVRLIASDMDGTLLDGDSRVPQETYDLILELEARGIGFVAASGRRYDTLRSMFEPVADHMSFVASNGAQVIDRGGLIGREIFSTAGIRRLVDVVAMFPTLHLVLFDQTRSFLLNDALCYQQEFDKDLPNQVYVLDVPSAEVDIIKASIYCDEALMDMAYVLSRELGEEFTFAPSGHQWIDVMQRGVSKATGLAQVLERRNIPASDVMAFGDAMNDYELLRMVGCSRAMGNARSAIKQIADRVIGTNDEQAVQKELRALVDKPRPRVVA